ncbi:hypothetical protein ACH44C_14130 [Streptomyces purpureus]|uniref:hypothetical protein n=1 Tax=Streptomyces purpureus TaxID=1951 RepID=UPI0037907CB4
MYLICATCDRRINGPAEKLGEMPSASGARPDRYAHQGLERDAPARFRRWPGLYRTSSA